MKTTRVQIKQLLEDNKLPTSDLDSGSIDFITRKSEGKVIACIGIEKYGSDALVRSFVVDEPFKNQGVGTDLLNELIRQCQMEGILQLHLLTTTAKEYFLKQGFVIASRNRAPETILTTNEFKDLCPDSAVYLTRTIS